MEVSISHKATIKTRMDNKSNLCKTLESMGIVYQEAIEGSKLKITSRYGVTADVDILLLNDSKGVDMKAVGFNKNSDGSYEAVGDFYEISSAKTVDGESLNQKSFKDSVSKRYTYHMAVNQLIQLGLSVENDVVDFKSNELQFTMSSNF